MITTVEEIQHAILNLSEAEYEQLKQWLHELEWERWDGEVEADSIAGNLDFLIAEALEAKRKGTLRDL